MTEKDSAFPESSLQYNRERDQEYIVTSPGLTKLEYFTLKIFCAIVNADDMIETDFDAMREAALKQAKLLLKEIEESNP